MKNSFFYLLLGCIISLSSCNKDRIVGEGNIVTETRAVTGFTKVSSSGSTDVTIYQGADFKVEVTGYGNLMPYFETKVVNGELLVGYKNNTNVQNDNLKVFITMPVINGISVSGSSQVFVKGDFNNIDNLETRISGSGNISIENGKAESLYSSISGSGKILSFGLQAKEVTADISGSGYMEVSVADKLNANISGSGKIIYKGTPVVNSHISGSGSVSKY